MSSVLHRGSIAQRDKQSIDKCPELFSVRNLHGDCKTFNLHTDSFTQTQSKKKETILYIEVPSLNVTSKLDTNRKNTLSRFPSLDVTSNINKMSREPERDKQNIE